LEELRDLYSAETQLIKALPKMVKGASSTELKQAFGNHLEQTEEHVDERGHRLHTSLAFGSTPFQFYFSFSFSGAALEYNSFDASVSLTNLANAVAEVVNR
jgi:Domain of unknown function (DUF892)